jgi:hypothetical protein
MRAYLTQSHEMLFDAHYHAFVAFGGIPERGIYDNMKTAVDKVGRGKQRQVNKRFHAMVGHYLFEPEFCNPAAGWEKGQVEKAVLDARQGLWYDPPPFKSLQDSTLAGGALPGAVAGDRASSAQGSLPGRVPGGRARRDDAGARGLRWLHRAQQAGLLDLPDHLRAQPLQRAGELRQSGGQPAGLSRAPGHRGRSPRRGRACARVQPRQGASWPDVYDWRHYLSVAQRKPGALRNGAPFLELPRASGNCESRLLKRPGGDREMVEVLALVLLHDEQLVEQAVARPWRWASPQSSTCSTA